MNGFFGFTIQFTFLYNLHTSESKKNSCYMEGSILNYFSNKETIFCMRIRIFFLRKFVKRTEKIIFSLVFVCFRFTGILYFLSFPSNENVRKQHLSANAYSCVNMKFSYTITVRKDKIFYIVLLRKQTIFN